MRVEIASDKISYIILRGHWCHIFVLSVYLFISPDGKPHNQIDHILVYRQRHASVLDARSFRTADCVLTTIWWWQKLGRD
jgi:hypothetical protein